MSDYISRDKLRKKKKYIFRTESGAFPKSEWFYKFDDVESIPSANVRENIHGEWCEYDNKYILMDAQRSVMRECMCKKCNGLAYFRISIITGKEIGNNFCPNCGADMRGDT